MKVSIIILALVFSVSVSMAQLDPVDGDNTEDEKNLIDLYKLGGEDGNVVTIQPVDDLTPVDGQIVVQSDPVATATSPKAFPHKRRISRKPNESKPLSNQDKKNTHLSKEEQPMDQIKAKKT